MIKQTYDSVYGTKVRIASKHMEEMVAVLQDLLEVIDMQNQPDNHMTEFFVEELFQQISIRLVLSSHSLKKLQGRITNNLPTARTTDEVGNFPDTIISSKECRIKIVSLIAIIDELALVSDKVKNSVNEKADMAESIQLIREHNISQYIQTTKETVLCITEFESILKDAIDWGKRRFEDDIDRMLRITHSEQLRDKFNDEIFQVSNNKELLNQLLQQFWVGKIAVNVFLHSLVAMQGTSGVPLTIEKLVTRIEGDLLEPLGERVRDVKDKTGKFYEELFMYVGKLHPFYKSNHFHLRGLYILLLHGIKPDLKNPEKTILVGEDYRTVWHAADNMEHVVKHVMPAHIRYLVDGFCRPLMDIIDITKRQLADIERRFLDLSAEAKSISEKYSADQLLEEEFVK